MIPAVTLVSNRLSSFQLRLSVLAVVLAGLILPVSARAQANLGAVNVGSSTTSTVTVTFQSAGTVGSIAVVTQGAANLDFTDAGGGSCAVGTAYAANATCTVVVSFSPKLAGTRYGGAVLDDNSGKVIATEFLQGAGAGPQIAFAPGTESVLATGVEVPSGLVVDGSGNLYFSDTSGWIVKETLAAGSYSESTIFTGLDTPGGLAVDGGGNIYIGDTYNNRVVKETLSAGSYVQSVVSTALYKPNSVSVDGSGNLFIADDYNGRVVKETLSGGNYTQSVVLTCGYTGGQSCPSSVAVDGSGNLFITAYSSSQILKLTPSGSGYTQTTIGNSLQWPSCIVVDGSGNLYIADTLNSRIVKETLTAGSYSQSTVASSSIDWPWGVAVDGNGNIYISDTYHARVLKEDLGDPPFLNFASTLVDSTSTDSPKTVQVENIGNAAMTFTGVSYPTDFPEVAGGGTDPCTGSTSLNTGQQCNLNINFTPQSLAHFSESVGLTDNALNVSGAQQSIGVNGIGSTQPAVSLSSTSLSFGNVEVETASASQMVTLTNTGTSTLLITSISITGANSSSFSFTNNCDTILAAGSLCTIQGTFKPVSARALTATIVITDNATGSPQGVSLSGTGVLPVMLSGSSVSVNVGSQAIGSTSAAQTLNFSIAAGTTVGSIAVVTQGATGLDFAEATGSTCAAQTYVSATNCTVNVTFTPRYAGLRSGAVVFYSAANNTGTQLGAAQVYGIGTGPQVSFHPGTQSTLFSVDSFPAGLAVDASGNVFFTDPGNNAVKEILAAGGYTTVKTLSTGYFHSFGVAVDGGGNVFFSDDNQNAVFEILAAGGYTTVNRLGSGFGHPWGVAVDASGNVYVADYYNSAVYEILAAGGYATVKTLGSDFYDPTGVAVDASGNVYVADYGNGAVYEILAAGGYATVKTLGSGFLYPAGVAVDASGNVYVADYGNSAVYEILAAGGYATVKTLGSDFYDPTGVAVDGSGNVFVADYMNSRVVKLDYADAPVLSFASTQVGTTSTDSPQTVQVQNIGNEALTFTGLSYPVDFPEASGDLNACTGSAGLNPGQQCDVPIDFTPLSSGPLSENVLLTDNALNVSGAQQAIGVSGTGISLTTISLSATSLAFGSQVIGTESATQQVTLTNSGSNTLYLASIGVGGANASSFDFGNTCGSSLAAGASCLIHGHFAPTAVGALTAAVSIAGNFTGSPQSIALSGTGTASGPTTVSLSSKSLSFGTLEVGTTSASQDVTVTNTGGITLSITSLGVTGANASSFIFTNTCGSSLAAGANCTIHGHFTPAAAGALTASVTIAGNATGSPLSIALSGTGYEPTTISLSSTDVSFGLQQVGTRSGSQDVTLTNTGSVVLAIASITVSGVDPSSFVVASNTSLWPNGCGSSLAVGASCVIHGHFAPTAEGPVTAIVTIADTANTSPHTIALRGTGYQPTTVSLSAASVYFGIEKVGIASASQDVTLTNTGAATLYIASIGVSGTDASSFDFANSTPVYPVGCGTSLAVGASCVIHGHFTPTVAGPLAARVIIADSVIGSPQRIALSGTGYDGPTTVSLSATSLSFGSQTVGTTSASQDVILTNTGGTALAIASITVTGANASSFVFANNCGPSLAAGASCTIHGHFTPVATGPLTAAVTITDNASGSPQSIALTGTGH